MNTLTQQQNPIGDPKATLVYSSQMVITAAIIGFYGSVIHTGIIDFYLSSGLVLPGFESMLLSLKIVGSALLIVASAFVFLVGAGWMLISLAFVIVEYVHYSLFGVAL
jgi:hypothetical protein